MSIIDRLTHAWNAFNRNQDSRIPMSSDLGYGTSTAMYKHAVHRFGNRGIVSTIFNQIAVDVSMVDINHVKIDPESQNESIMSSGIQRCLTVEANIDQSNRDFIHDLVYSMFDEGSVAVVPVDTTLNPNVSGSYDITTMRVGKVTQWYPKKVEVELYNEAKGDVERIILDKRYVAIIENPLYSVVNGDNTTVKRLIDKLALLDASDAITSGGKLDLIMQLPYVVKGETRQKQAKERLLELEKQLEEGSYGIAYIDGTEKITQLNRAVNNSLPEQVAQLKKELYNQLGLTENIFNGTASEQEMLTYYSRTIDPILTRIVAEFKRKFLTQTAITQGQTFSYRRNPFKLVPVEQLAQVADTFKRNAILSTNEIRPIVGFGPSSDPRADELYNPNIADTNQDPTVSATRATAPPPENG